MTQGMNVLETNTEHIWVSERGYINLTRPVNGQWSGVSINPMVMNLILENEGNWVVDPRWIRERWRLSKCRCGCAAFIDHETPLLSTGKPSIIEYRISAEAYEFLKEKTP